MSELTAAETIKNAVDYDSSGFSFLSTVYDLVGNREYAQPCGECLAGADNARTFYWKALSAVGDELADAVYANVKNYIQYVSDVDTCKIKSLRSMLQLFNYKCTMLDGLFDMPAEVLKAMDILSIDKKYLKKAGFVTDLLRRDMELDGVIMSVLSPTSRSFFNGDFRTEFADCSYKLSTDAGSTESVNVSYMQRPYSSAQPVSVFLNMTPDMTMHPRRVESLVARGYSEDAVNWLSTIPGAIVYSNDRGYSVVDDRPAGNIEGALYVCDGSMRRVFQIDTSYDMQRFAGDSVLCCISDVYALALTRLEPGEYDAEWLRRNDMKSVELRLSSAHMYDGIMMDDDSYSEYLAGLYESMLYGYVTMTYNVSANYMTHVGKVYVYPYLGSDYYETSAKYSEYVGYEDDAILSVKLANHVARSFDEKAVYDAIERGEDWLCAYSGAQLCVLTMEKKHREAPLLPSGIALPAAYGDSQLTLRQNQTRYSYYRTQKVLEYARFVDMYYASLQTQGEAGVYDFNPNYWVLSGMPHDKVVSCPASVENVDPSKDVRRDMIRTVAEKLASMTQYVCKLRHELKLQTQKNYMRGTNLLLIYIVNEYLRDYARHNGLSGGVLREPGFSGIRDMLAGHSLRGTSDSGYSVNVQEYYDETEYFNIKSGSTASADMSADVNSRFWELTSFDSPDMMKGDGGAFQLAEIEKFYLSSLELDRSVSGDLPSFLSTIYDVGANNAFIYTGLSGALSAIYSSTLSDGQYASDIARRLIALSGAYEAFTSAYLSAGDYHSNGGTVAEQVSDMLSSYVYPNLSTEYLAGISDIYEKYVIQLDSLSAEVGSLSSSYVRFAQTDYSCYYSKSESKFCYSDHDVDAGLYLFPYFNGNPDYDDEDDNLYNHLYQIQRYTVESNIKNFALISTLAYVNDSLSEISGSLRSEVVDDLESEHGFTDINSSTLDGELQYVYDFINDMIDSRLDFLRSQLQSLQAQAQNLKTSYDTLNNTFTNAVAGFNDNNNGYKLGDSEILWFSLYADSSQGSANRHAKSAGRPTDKKWDFIVFVADEGDGYWYYGQSGKSGKYIMGSTSVTPYSADDSLEARCDEVLEYMSAPTSLQSAGGQYNYGLRNEGIVTVCDNIKSGLRDIQTSFDNLADLAENLFGIERPSQTDIYANILDLVDKLTSVDESFFIEDESVQKYKEYFSKTVQLSSRYQPVKTEYNRIFTDKGQTSFLLEFSRQDGLTFENIMELSSYIGRTDRKNLSAMTAKIAQMIGPDFQALLDEKTGLERLMQEDDVPGVKPTTGNAIESRVAQMHDALLEDVAVKASAGMREIQRHKDGITNVYGEGYVDVMTSEISADMVTTKDFRSCVMDAISRLNFFDHDIYKKYKDMFLTYGGRSFCYDPYYNMKNVTHPSYQIHPYLWNFVKKMNGDTLVESGFKSRSVEDLTDMNVVSWLKSAAGIGQFGQTVNTWRCANDGLADYSGYMSMYEKESNWSSKLNAVHEVVDYEGAFYPPALAYFREFPSQAISSVYGRVTRSRLYTSAIESMSEALSGAVSSYVQFDETGSPAVSSYAVFAQAVSGCVYAYVPSSECSFERELSAYFAQPSACVSSVGWDGVRRAVHAGIPQTFYEKYYSHVDLTNAEARRIAAQLAEYRDEILELTDPKPEAEQYDIYRYGIDINKTHYALFKRYSLSGLDGLDDLTYEAKRNTLGRMWIRLADQPIAFPAFSGSDPAYYIRDPNEVTPIILKLAGKAAGGVVYADRDNSEITRIDDDVCYFYDFEMASNRASLAYVVFDPEYPLENPFYRQYRLANVVVGKVDRYASQSDDVTYLRFSNSYSESGKSHVDYVDFHRSNTFGYTPSQDVLDVSALLSGGVRYPALVGCHQYGNNGINFVYSYQDFRAVDVGSGAYEDRTLICGDSSGRLRSFVVEVKNGQTYQKIPSGNATFDLTLAGMAGHVVCGGSMCVGYNRQSERLTFAYATRLASGSAAEYGVETTPHGVPLSASDGPAPGDPLARESNSHDTFGQNVTLVEAAYKAGSLSLVSVKDYNTNADIAYIPVYSGYQHDFSIPSCYGVLDQDSGCRVISDEYHSIELLGSSKDIDEYIDMVNPDPDPYFDYDKVKSDYEFGRVYEDYQREFENSFTQVRNPSISFNSASRYGQYNEVRVGMGCFAWTISLNRINPKPFTFNDLRNMQVIIYNVNSLGKSPYYMGDLWALRTNAELGYDEYVKNSDVADIQLSGQGSNGRFYASGTRSDVRRRGLYDTNRIDFISSVKAGLYAEEDDVANAALTLTFELEPGYLAGRFAKVPDGEIVVMLYNTKSLEVYQYYHMLDAYGAVQCKFYEYLIDDGISPDDGRGWGIYRVDGSGNRPAEDSFFKDESGLKTYLDSVRLEGYDALSDVYVYRGNKRLSFKNEETYRFPTSSDMYYYPTLNVSYPKVPAQFVESNTSFDTGSMADVSAMHGMFDESNIFVVTLEDANYIADRVGQVDIPKTYAETDDIRAYEDYLDYDEEAGLYNYEKYDVGDPRLAQYLRFSTADGGAVELGGGIDVASEYCENVSMDDFLTAARRSYGVMPRGSEDSSGASSAEYVRADVSRAACDLQSLLKLYVSYSYDKERQSIDLYFNYFNYFDSPYVKIEDGKDVKLDTIRSTYLKLSPDQDGYLDIVAQFKYYEGDQLYGYKNVTLLSYRIYNISDDKPKFLLYKTYEVVKDSAVAEAEKGLVRIGVESQPVDLESFGRDEKAAGAIYVTVQANKPLKAPYCFYLNFPDNVISVRQDGGQGYYVDQEGSAAGLLRVVVTNTSQRSYAFRFETVETAQAVGGYRNRRYAVSIDEAAVLDEDGLTCEVQTGEATVEFAKTTVDVIATKDRSGAVGAYVAAPRDAGVVRLTDVAD